MSSTSSTPQWVERIASIHQQRATPDTLARIRRQSDVERQLEVTRKQAKRVSTSMNLSSLAWTSGVASATATPLRSSTSITAMQDLSSPLRPVYRGGAAPRSIDEQEAAEDALEQELERAMHQHVEGGSLALADAQAVASAGADPAAQRAQQTQQDRSLADALRELETEPADEETCAAKFTLYEGYAKLTCDARDAVTELAAASQATLTAADSAHTAQIIAADLRHLDRDPHNLGVVMDEPLAKWFVHGMCMASVHNQRKLQRLTDGIRAKLELLASQTECPMCLEPIGAPHAKPVHVLSCAHKCCAECWGHWCAVGNGRVAHCPLCRHEEFLERVMRAAAVPGGEVEVGLN